MRKQLQRMFCVATAIVFSMTCTFMASAQIPGAAQTNVVKMPKFMQGYEPLPEGILAWDALSKTVTATNGQGVARFIFNFTNVTTNKRVGS